MWRRFTREGNKNIEQAHSKNQCSIITSPSNQYVIFYAILKLFNRWTNSYFVYKCFYIFFHKRRILNRYIWTYNHTNWTNCTTCRSINTFYYILISGQHISNTHTGIDEKWEHAKLYNIPYKLTIAICMVRKLICVYVTILLMCTSL